MIYNFTLLLILVTCLYSSNTFAQEVADPKNSSINQRNCHSYESDKTLCLKKCDNNLYDCAWACLSAYYSNKFSCINILPSTDVEKFKYVSTPVDPKEKISVKKDLSRHNWIYPVATAFSKNFIASLYLDKAGLIFNLPGSSVSASSDGVVVFNGVLNGHGKTIVIKHSNTILTAYSGNAENIAPNGAEVKMGERIAIAGDDTYFEVRHKGKKLDPEWLFE
jgi:Peptidase family M23